MPLPLQPEHPTEEQIEALIRYHETESALYAGCGQLTFAKWAHDQAEDWRRKLAEKGASQ